DQSGTAYLILPTALAALLLNSQADDSSDEEQQTIVVASTVLGQLIQQVNTLVFAESPSGLVLMADDMAANSMPQVLEGLDEPMLALTATLDGGRPLPFTLLLPGTFLDILAGAMAGHTAAPAAAGASGAAAALPFTLTADDLDLAELLEDDAVAEAPELVAVGQARDDQAARRAGGAQREPTPIASASAAQRARFAPLPEPPIQATHSNIDLLAGLQMNVTVELGRTELTVADVLGLGPGSVVELDRLAGEPVDILVNDRLIARGEVVVVDENFGVRVVEVVRRGLEQEERVS
ncbi:MAG: flagellar motor switch protein FliN, partial [Tepidiformaceae bacterium]